MIFILLEISDLILHLKYAGITFMILWEFLVLTITLVTTFVIPNEKKTNGTIVITSTLRKQIYSQYLKMLI